MCTTMRRMTVTLLLLLAVFSCGSALPPPSQGGSLSPSQTLADAASVSMDQASSNESAAETEDDFKRYPGAAAETAQLPVHEQEEQVQAEREEEFSREESVADSSEELQGNSRSAEASLQHENVTKIAEPEPHESSAVDDYNDDSDMFLEPEEEEEQDESKIALQQSPEQIPETTASINTREADAAGMAQHFFPAFAPLFPGPPPLGHSRPSLYQEPAQSHRSPLLRSQQNGFQPLSFGTAFRENAYFHNPVTSETKSNNLLGSGNFGVIRGGTFYDEDDRDYGGRGGLYSSYQNNGHGRPAFHGNPRPQHGNDFFSNFRDFADINTPKSSFSEYVVVYVNKNASRHDSNDEQKVLASGNFKPKNIIEQLRMLDGEGEEKYAAPDSLYAVPSPSPDAYQEKVSKKTGSSLSPAKQKLALYQEKFNKNKKSKKIISAVPKDLYEPLLALS